MSDDQDPQILKIVIIGESSVGKTSIISQFVDKIFQEEIQSTVGGSFNSKTILCEDLDKKVKLEIWDTAGQERYRSVTKMFYKDADIAVLVYDITNKDSYDELKNYWVEQVKDSTRKGTNLVIVANKSDLIEKEQVDEDESRNYARSINASFFVVSAKDSISVGELFKEIVKKYTGSKNVSIVDENDESAFHFKKIRKESIKLIAENPKKKKSCC